MTKGRCIHCQRAGLEIKCAIGLDPVAMAKAACAPGENYKDGLMLRIPCDTKELDIALFTRDGGKLNDGQCRAIEQKATCSSFTGPTDAQVADHNAEIDALVKRFQITVPLIEKIKHEHKGKEWRGTDTCPACGGTLHLSHAAYNGHVWGKCETAGCLSWME